MALPKIAVPTYNLTIPSSKLKIKFRPFLVKEEKILLMALESGNEAEMAESIKQILESCVLTKEFDTDALTVFDIEYMFLQLRAKSVGEIATPRIDCPKCQAPIELSIDISKIKPKITKQHSNEVMLKDPIGVVLRYPQLDNVAILEADSGSEINRMFEFIKSSIVAIYDDKQVYDTKDHTDEEMNEFIEGLGPQEYKKIEDFFENMPKLKHTVAYTCPGCEHKDTIVLEGLQSFFQ